MRGRGLCTVDLQLLYCNVGISCLYLRTVRFANSFCLDSMEVQSEPIYLCSTYTCVFEQLVCGSSYSLTNSV